MFKLIVPTIHSNSFRTRTCILFLSALLLTACEAPLNLEGVEAQSKLATLRFDQYQAASTNKKSIVVVGSAGVVLSSDDNGENWSRMVLPGKTPLTDITACPDGTYAILDFSRQIWISTDNAKSWSNKPIDSTEVPLVITCSPDNQIWVAESFSTIISTPDQGDTWKKVSLEEDLMLTNLQFVTDKVAFASGEFGTVLKSSDAGQTWEYLEPLPGEFYPEASFFQDENTGWVVGLAGKILHTKDGGESWQLQPTNTDKPIYGIRKSEDSALYAVGENGLLLGYLNNKWKQIEHGFPIRFYLRAVQPLEDKAILIAGGSGVLHKLKVDQ